MDVISISTVKARKTHECDWCGNQILIGESYEKQVLSDSGQIITWKNHIKCSKIATFLNMFDDTDGDGLSSDDFKEYIHDEFSTIMSEKFTKKYESKDFKHLLFSEELDFVCRYYLDENNQRVKSSMLL